MTTRLAEVGASVGKLHDIGDLDGMETRSREITWLGCLWKTIAKGVPTARIFVTAIPDSLTYGFFNFFPLLVHIFLFVAMIGN